MLLFDPEDGGDIFFRNIRALSELHDFTIRTVLSIVTAARASKSSNGKFKFKQR
jgi:hypothetical protein